MLTLDGTVFSMEGIDSDISPCLLKQTSFVKFILTTRQPLKFLIALTQSLESMRKLFVSLLK